MSVKVLHQSCGEHFIGDSFDSRWWWWWCFDIIGGVDDDGGGVTDGDLNDKFFGNEFVVVVICLGIIDVCVVGIVDKVDEQFVSAVGDDAMWDMKGAKLIFLSPIWKFMWWLLSWLLNCACSLFIL